MASRLDHERGFECIENLARAIARSAPECATEAMQIVDCVQDMRLTPDRVAVLDAMEASMVDADVSDAQLQVTTSAVISAAKGS